VGGTGIPDQVLLAALVTCPDGFLLIDRHATIVYANEATRVVSGWAPEELVGTGMTDHLHPDDLYTALAGLADSEARGSQVRTPGLFRMRERDGTYSLFEISSNPIDVPGHERLHSVFVRRAEDLARTQEVLQRLASQFDTEEALTSIPEQLRWRHDGPRTAITWEDDQGVRRAFGDELSPELVGLLAETDDTSPWRAAWRGEERGGVSKDLPKHLRRIAEQEGLTEFHVYPVIAESGRVWALLSLWGHDASLPLPLFDAIARSMCDSILVTLAHGARLTQLVHHAEHDALTGLVNRRRFQTELAESVPPDVNSAADTGTGTGALSGEMAVIYVDLDGFKPINDKFGHTAGDVVLVAVAQRLVSSCRSDDLVARLGGDEFAAICRACPPEEATSIAARFLDALAEPIDIGYTHVNVCASVG